MQYSMNKFFSWSKNHFHLILWTLAKNPDSSSSYFLLVEWNICLSHRGTKKARRLYISVLLMQGYVCSMCLPNRLQIVISDNKSQSQD